MPAWNYRLLREKSEPADYIARVGLGLPPGPVVKGWSVGHCVGAMEQTMLSACASIAEANAQGVGGKGKVILATVLVFTCAYWILGLQKEKRKFKGLMFPPGAVGLPYFIWDTLKFIRSHDRNELKQFFDQKVAKYGPVFKLSIMGDTIVLLNPPAGNKFLLGSSEHTLVRKAYPKSMSDLTVVNSLLTLEEEPYKIVRRQLLGKFLGPDSMLRYVGKMERNVLHHLGKHWVGKEETREEICTYNTVQTFTFRFIVELCFGLTDSIKTTTLDNAFLEWSDGLLSWPIKLPGFRFYRAHRARAVIDEAICELMGRRRQELKEGSAAPDQDLLSVLLSSQSDDSSHLWTDDRIRDNLLLLLYAGHDTTAATLTMTISDIAKHPDVFEKLIKEHALIAATKKEGEPLSMEDLRRMTYTWQVVQETLRHTTIVPLGFREAKQDFQYNGYTILKGWKIFWSQDRTHRQADFFENPERYDPSRFAPGVRRSPYVFVPFGAGLRICPGIEFAKMEMLIFLHHLVRRFKWSLVDPEEKVVRVYMPRTKKGSPIRITRHLKPFNGN